MLMVVHVHGLISQSIDCHRENVRGLFRFAWHIHLKKQLSTISNALLKKHEKFMHENEVNLHTLWTSVDEPLVSFKFEK